MNFVRLDGQTHLAGIIVSDMPGRSKVQKRKARLHPEACVKSSALETVLDRVFDLEIGVAVDLERDIDQLAKDALESPEVTARIVGELREVAAKNLHQSHDFLQLAKLIRGYCVTIFEQRFPGVPPDEAAEKLPNEGAIYFATELMLGKIDATLYLNEPNLAFGQERRFNVHPFVTKYLRIYRWQAEQKSLDLGAGNQCEASVTYSSEAIGVVVQALLDNLVKYAPPYSRADVMFVETTDAVVLSFTSLGPKIRDDERTKIFMPTYRAEAARTYASSGLGIGLAAAKQISDTLDLDLTVKQASESEPAHKALFRTTFSFRLSK